MHVSIILEVVIVVLLALIISFAITSWVSLILCGAVGAIMGFWHPLAHLDNE
jgi:hypothetical protein